MRHTEDTADIQTALDAVRQLLGPLTSLCSCGYGTEVCSETVVVVAQCYCFVCDIKAQDCQYWGDGEHSRSCSASAGTQRSQQLIKCLFAELLHRLYLLECFGPANSSSWCNSN